MLEPALVALTSTPSIAGSLTELTTPVSAATSAWAESMQADATTTKAAPTRAANEWCMVSPTPIFIGCRQHSLGCVQRASPPSAIGKTPVCLPRRCWTEVTGAIGGWASARRNYVWQGTDERLILED